MAYLQKRGLVVSDGLKSLAQPLRVSVYLRNSCLVLCIQPFRRLNPPGQIFLASLYAALSPDLNATFWALSSEWTSPVSMISDWCAS